MSELKPENVILNLEQLITLLDDSIPEARRLRGDVCAAVVERNAVIQAIETGGSKALVEGFKLTSVSSDWSLKVDCEQIEGAFAHARMKAEALVEDVHKLLATYQSDNRALSVAFREAEDRAAALLARHKEHALHKTEVRDAVWAITGGKCFYCRIDLMRTAEEATSLSDGHRLFHVDHLVAKDCGGPDHLANYVPACQRCNLSKSNKPFAEFSRRHEQQPQLSVIEGGAA